jgi:hypothetical protein
MAALCALIEPNPDEGRALFKELEQEHERVLVALDAEERV